MSLSPSTRLGLASDRRRPERLAETESTKTVAEYFAGIGLIRMGLESCGWHVGFANDISAKKFQMYRSFFPQDFDHYVIDDVFALDPTRIPKTLLATSAFPCIDLSLAGNMGGINGRHSSAFWGFVHALKAQGDSAPDIVLVENVPGWLSSNFGMDFRETVKALNHVGYACDVFTLDALHFTPQSRLRVFLVGSRSRSANNDFGLLCRRPSSLVSTRLRKCILQNRDLNWVFLSIPEPPPRRDCGLSDIIEPMETDDPRWWPEKEVTRHLGMMGERHLARVKELARLDVLTYRAFYRRRREGRQRAEVRNDDLSGCLRTAVGGSGKQFLIRAGHGSVMMRAMTPREYARLQGVPDTYPITVNTVQAMTGFGDAVCVPAISWISNNVLERLVQRIQ